jgi:hypothetical protein
MCLVVAVIEMGTEYSICAFSWTHQLATYQHEIDIADLITCVNFDVHIKTPTCLLLDGRKQYVAFGSDAVNRYAIYFIRNYHLVDISSSGVFVPDDITWSISLLVEYLFPMVSPGRYLF